MIKLTSIGKTKFFEYNYNLVDENNIRFAYFDSTLSTQDVVTICENWQHNSSDLEKLASPTLFQFRNINLVSGDPVTVYTGFSRSFNVAFKSAAVTLDGSFTKDTNGLAAVIDVNNGNICLGYIQVMIETVGNLNEPGVEQSWSGDVVGKLEDTSYSGRYNTGAACYNPRQVGEIITGSIDMSQVTFSLFYIADGLPIITNPLYTTRSEILNLFTPPHEQILAEDVTINNFRYDDVDGKYTFDPQFINFSADLGLIGSDSTPIYLAIEGAGGSGEKLPIVMAWFKITNARGGIFITPDVDGFFNFV